MVSWTGLNGDSSFFGRNFMGFPSGNGQFMALKCWCFIGFERVLFMGFHGIWCFFWFMGFFMGFIGWVNGFHGDSMGHGLTIGLSSLIIVHDVYLPIAKTRVAQISFRATYSFSWEVTDSDTNTTGKVVLRPISTHLLWDANNKRND